MPTALEHIECPECGQIVHYQPQRWKAQVICSNCQESIEVEAGSTATPQNEAASPIPSHLKSNEENPPEIPPQKQPPGSEPIMYKRSKITGTLISTMVLVVSLVGVGVGIAAIVMYDSKNDDDRKEERKKEKKKIDQDKIDYTLATKKRLKLKNMEVGIDMVEFGPIRVKDQNFKVHNSNESFLQIYVELRSRRKGDASFQSWYGRSFKRNGEDLIANLTDQNGTAINMAVFDDINKIFGHIDKATIGPNERLKDCLIFELPENISVADLEELRLSLPMEAVGSPGDVHFKIPQEMIQVVSEND